MAFIEYHVADHIALMRMNRPERLNAMSREMREELVDAFRRFNADDDAWVAILTGTGRGFCAGRDLKAQAEGYRPDAGPGAVQLGARVYTPESNMFGLSDTNKPLIAAVNGFAIGMGWYMVAQCDIRIASEQAVFAMTEIPTGVLGPYWFGPGELVPWPLAAEFALLGERVPASRLLSLGLLNAVVRPDDLMSEAQRWAEKFTRLPPRHVQHTKAMMLAMRTLPDAAMLAREREARTYLNALADSREAVEAFAEKRQPRFQGS